MTLKLKPRERGETDTIDKNLIPSWEDREEEVNARKRKKSG